MSGVSELSLEEIRALVVAKVKWLSGVPRYVFADGGWVAYKDCLTGGWYSGGKVASQCSRTAYAIARKLEKLGVKEL